MKVWTLPLIGFAFVLGTATAASAQKNRSTCGFDEYLRVEVSGTPAAPDGYGIVSDGNGLYVHGTPRALVARFQIENCTHDFTLQLHNTRRATWALLPNGPVAGFFFNLDRVHSVPLTSDSNFFNSDFCTQGVVRNADGSIRRNADGSYQDNYGGCFLDEAGVPFVRRAASFGLDGDAHLIFNVSPIDRTTCTGDTTNANPTCSASHVRVYHPTADQWVITSEAPALANHTMWTGGKTGYQSQGLVAAPFRIVATRQ